MKRTADDSSPRNEQYPKIPAQNPSVNPQNTTTPQPLTHELYEQLADHLLKKDFESATRIAGVSDIEQLAQLAYTKQETLLMHAAISGNFELIQVLLSNVSNPDALASLKDEYGYTALMHATASCDNKTGSIHDIYNAHLKSIKELFHGVHNRDALASLKDHVKIELMDAIDNKHIKSIKALLHGVKNPDALASLKNIHGEHVLASAAEHNYFLAIEAILSGVNNPDELACLIDGEGQIALMYAANNNHRESIKAILSSVSNTKQLACMRNQDDCNALDLAASTGSPQTIQALLDYVNDPIELIYSSCNNGKTALMLCIYNDKEDDYIYSNPITAILEKIYKVGQEKANEIRNLGPRKFLLDEKKNALKVPSIDPLIFLKDSNGMNALRVPSIDSLIFLKDSEGMNAFMLAAKVKNIEAVLTLLIWTTDNLALFTEKNNSQQTALDFVDENMCDLLIENLEELKISMDIRNLDDLLTILRKHKASFH